MVNLIIHPATGANSFVTVLEADVIAEDSLFFSKWNNLSTDDKSRYLILAFDRIVMLDGISLPATPEECINSTQVEIAIHDLVNGISVKTGTAGGEIKKAKVGPISVEYTEGTSATTSTSLIPGTSWYCLEQYGATIALSGSQIKLQRG